jgi:hypothetical protein
MTEDAESPRGRCVGTRLAEFSEVMGGMGPRGLSRRCSGLPEGRGGITAGAAERGGGTRGAAREGGPPENDQLKFKSKQTSCTYHSREYRVGTFRSAKA